MELWIGNNLVAIGSLIIAFGSAVLAGLALHFNSIQARAAEASAKAAEKSAEMAKQAVGEGFRPYVIVNLYTLDYSLDIEIVNIGNRPAKDIIIEVNPGFEDFEELEIFSGLITAIKRMFNHKYLSPNQPIKTSILVSSLYLEKFKKLDNDIRTFSLKYKSLEDVSYELEYNIDIKDFLIGEKTIDLSFKSLIKDIEKQLKDLNKNLKNFNKPL